MSFSKKTVKDVPIRAKKVLLRADFNVPLDEHGQILSDYRIKQALETIEYLRSHSCKVVIISHLGRPGGKEVPSLSLKQVAEKLSSLLGDNVDFIDELTGSRVKRRIEELKPKQVLLLENLRFDPREKKNDPELAKELAEGMDLFVQDGFGVVHRAHASTDAITQHLPSVSGLLLEHEVGTIVKAMDEPKKPLMAVVGGAKISDKIELLEHFINVCDFVAIGGAMANTFLKADGINIGDSLYEEDSLDKARDILELAKKREASEDFTFYVPQDGVVTTNIDSKTTTRIVDWGSHSLADISSYPKRPSDEAFTVAPDEKIVDIGPVSSHYIAGALQAVGTVLWNGTMGIAEIPGLAGAQAPFGHGTRVIYETLTSTPGSKPYSVVGGGETAAYVMGGQGKHLSHQIDHISTGGGASLELMAGKKLPGVEALEDKQ